MKPTITIFNGPYPTVNEELDARISGLQRTASRAFKTRDLDAYLNAKYQIRRLERQRDLENLLAYS